MLGNLGLIAKTDMCAQLLTNAATIEANLEELGVSSNGMFLGADVATGHVLKVALKYHSEGFQVWLSGHSRGAALMSQAGLACSEKLAGIISFEGPGLPMTVVQNQQPVCPEKFVQYNTFPNLITLWHPPVIKELLFHIPACSIFETNTWTFTGRCLVTDANRALN